MSTTERDSATPPGLLLPFLLGLCIVRLWLMPLPSSFWLDETVTVFVVRHGSQHPSLSVAPQVAKSVYYFLPRIAAALLGNSEIAYRLPSTLALALSLFLVARLGSRLIHPQAAWLAVFACLSLRGFNYQAADARPYALGTCLASAGIMFLVRWLDSGRWLDALLFAGCGAVLWRIHLLYWPAYIIFAAYALLRLSRGDSAASRNSVAAVILLLALALIPALPEAAALFRQAGEHVIAPLPSARSFVYSLKPGLIAACAAGAWMLSRWSRASPCAPLQLSSLALLLAWWLVAPVCLLAESWLTGDSVFVPRYLSLALPGAALAATAAASRFLPPAGWRAAATLLGLVALLSGGQWRRPWPVHENSDWRAAAAQINALEAAGPGASPIPVLCPSPFVEAREPAWRPDYRLPGFLYSHLEAYPITGSVRLLPFRASAAEPQTAGIDLASLTRTGRFVIYGWEPQVHFWRNWLQSQPELAHWNQRPLGPFGDVAVEMFEGGAGRTGN